MAIDPAESAHDSADAEAFTTQTNSDIGGHFFVGATGEASSVWFLALLISDIGGLKSRILSLNTTNRRDVLGLVFEKKILMIACLVKRRVVSVAEDHVDRRQRRSHAMGRVLMIGFRKMRKRLA